MKMESESNTSNDLLRILLASAVQEGTAVKIKSKDGKTLYYLK
jgi:hypothetical protein